MILRILAWLLMTAVATAASFAFISCSQPKTSTTVEVPTTVDVEVIATLEVTPEIEVTREVTVIVEVERTVLSTVEIPVTVEVPVEVNTWVYYTVPYRIVPNELGIDACVEFIEFRSDDTVTFEKFENSLMTVPNGFNEIRPAVLQDVFQSAISANRVRLEAGEHADQDEIEQANRILEIADFYCNTVMELDCDRWIEELDFDEPPRYCW